MRMRSHENDCAQEQAGVATCYEKYEQLCRRLSDLGI